jgi:hypothetical protein
MTRESSYPNYSRRIFLYKRRLRVCEVSSLTQAQMSINVQRISDGRYGTYGTELSPDVIANLRGRVKIFLKNRSRVPQAPSGRRRKAVHNVAGGRCAAKTVLVRRPVRPPAMWQQILWYVLLVFSHNFNDCWLRVYGRSGAAGPLRL